MFRKAIIGETFVIPLVILVTIVAAALFIAAVSFTVHVKAAPTFSASSLGPSSEDSRVLADSFLSDRLVVNDGSVSFEQVTVPLSVKSQLMPSVSLSVRESLVVLASLYLSLASSEGIPPAFRSLFASVEHRFAELYSCSADSSFVVVAPGVQGDVFLYDYPASSWNGTGTLLRVASITSDATVYPFNEKGIADGYFIDASLGHGIKVAIRGSVLC